MKKLWVTFLLCEVILTGCVDPLQEEVYSFISTDNFYKTSVDAEAAVFASYEPFLSPQYFGFEFYNLCLLADDQVTIGRNPVFQEVDNFNLTAEHSFTTNVWRQMYRGINLANTAIQRIPGIEMDENLKSSLLGEVYFIRAYNFFNLVRLFGGVPLPITEINVPDLTNTPKSTKEQVYEQIINDLVEAEQRLPLSRSGSELGRITKGAAQSMLAEVYLTLERWGEAAGKADEVIQAGQYRLLDNFEEIFSENNENNAEIIFSIQFDGAIRGNSLTAYAHGGGTNNPNTAIGAQVWSVEVLSDMWQNWRDEDSRKQFSVYTEFVSRTGETINLMNTERPFPAFGKYNSPTETDQGRSPLNPIVHRFADVLLIYAEAKSMAAGSPGVDAYEAINQVRRRAYNMPLTMPSSVDLPIGMKLEEFRNAVIQERSLEFVIENKRLFDLMRTGRFPSILKLQGKNINENAVLFPIPQSEIDANSALSIEDQNEGY